MHADYFFRMGATHAVCQDYAAAGQADGVTYAMLSDGCSGSPTDEPGSPFTDFGARFLVRAARRHLQLMCSDTFPSLVIHEAAAMARQAMLPRQSLDATLLVATRAPGAGVQVFQAGDGIVAARRRSGDFEFSAIEFSKGIPLYLSYLLSGEARARFDAEEQSMTIETGGPGRAEFLWPQAPAVSRLLTFDAAIYDLVLLLSDGAQSFVERDGRAVPLPTVLAQVFDFKNLTGQFLARRCGRFLSSYCAEQGWRHADDFSVAGIYLGGGA